MDQNKKMMDALTKLTEQDLDDEVEKPRALRIYPIAGARDPEGIEILWAPFDYVNRGAKLVIVGVTPGPNQALRSLRATQRAAAMGEDPQRKLENIKAESSFRGDVIEANLKSLLEHSGLSEQAGIEDIDGLWTTEASKVHFTSTIRYPTFINGELFNNQIDSLRHPELRRYIDSYLAEELSTVSSDASIVALGQKGPRLVRHAAKVAGVDPNRVVALPHPSGSATGAVRDFLSKRRTQSERACRCMLCDRSRIPNGWDLSSRYKLHDATHGRSGQ